MNLPTKEELELVVKSMRSRASGASVSTDSFVTAQQRTAALLHAIARGDLVVCVTAGGVWREERNEVDYDYTPAREIPEPKT